MDSRLLVHTGLQALKEVVGWRSTCLIVGAAQLNIAVCGALLRPLARPQAKLCYVPELNKCSQGDVAGSPKANELACPFVDTCAVIDVDTEVVTDILPETSFVAPVIPDSSSTCLNPTASTCAVLDVNADASVAQRSYDVLNVNMVVTVHCSDDKSTVAESATRLVTSFTAPCKVLDSDVSKNPVSTRPGVSVLDLSLFSEAPFVCYALYGLFATFGFFVPQPLLLHER